MSNRATFPLFVRARRLARYNWPLYAGASGAVVIGVVLAVWPGGPLWGRVLGVVGAAIAVWFASASFLAFHWMFDRSDLLDGAWLAPLLPVTPRRWTQVTVGLEETTLPLAMLFPAATGETLDLYDPVVMTEPAVNRAKGQAATALRPARADALPIEDAASDVIVVMLAAHEVREPVQRAKFLTELRRGVAPDGRVVVVEHSRDAWAFAAFGPAAQHFYAPAQWRRELAAAGLTVERERTLSPFVRVYVTRRQGEERPS